MECPNCGDRNTTVKDSRKVEMNVFRIRHCKKCELHKEYKKIEN